MPATDAVDRRRRRGRPRKLTADDEIRIVQLRSTGACWKDLQMQYDMSRSNLYEAWRRGVERISGQLSEFSGHLDAGQQSLPLTKLEPI